MLIQFTVGNYRSFSDPVTLSMVAAPLKAVDPAIDAANTIELPGAPKLLTCAAIYGPNASGKSNLIRAMGVMKQIVVNSARGGQIGDRLPVEPFLLSKKTRDEPTHFEIVFTHEERQYRYGFEATQEAVKSEWLYQKKQRETMVFERNGGEEPYFSDWIPDARKLLPMTRLNSLFLSVAAQFNQPVAARLVGWFDRLQVIMSDGSLAYERPGMMDYTRVFVARDDNRERVANLIRSMDTGIADFRVELTMHEQLGKSTIVVAHNDGHEKILGPIKTIHAYFNAAGERLGTVEFDLFDQESGGTARLFALAGSILDGIDTGKILIIDEIEAHLHPRIVREIIRMFTENRPIGSTAQLIATTHDTHLLDERLLRRDQLWLVEKSREGASDLYSLAEIKVRNDANYEARYLGGAYGGVPVVDTMGLIRTVRGVGE